MRDTDAIIREADIRQINKDIETHVWHHAIYELLRREPELALVFGERLGKINTLLEQAISDPNLRQRLETQIYLMMWVPMILLDRAHRRLWEDFLPEAAGDEHRWGAPALTEEKSRKNPCSDSETWQALTPDKRRRLTAALAALPQTWIRFLIPGKTTEQDVAKFARASLLRGFLELPSRIVTAVTAVRVPDGVELLLACAPHPSNITLPAWGCGMLGAVQLVFGEATPLVAVNKGNNS